MKPIISIAVLCCALLAPAYAQNSGVDVLSARHAYKDCVAAQAQTLSSAPASPYEISLAAVYRCKDAAANLWAATLTDHRERVSKNEKEGRQVADDRLDRDSTEMIRMAVNIVITSRMDVDR